MVRLHPFSSKLTNSTRVLFLLVALVLQVNAIASDVAFDGFAYAGDMQTSAARLP